MVEIIFTVDTNYVDKLQYFFHWCFHPFSTCPPWPCFPGVFRLYLFPMLVFFLSKSFSYLCHPIYICIFVAVMCLPCYFFLCIIDMLFLFISIPWCTGTPYKIFSTLLCFYRVVYYLYLLSGNGWVSMDIYLPCKFYTTSSYFHKH